MSCDLRRLFNDHHAAAHPAIELAHLKSYVTAADNRQARWKFCLFKPVFGADKVNVFQAINRRQETARACINHSLRSCHFAYANAHAEVFAVSPCETSV